jgi:hypothetical protein
MPDWQTIFKNTEKCLTRQERHWNALALLKLTGPERARATFFAGDLTFQHMPQNQLLLCEIEKVEGQNKAARQRLKQIDTRQLNPKQREQRDRLLHKLEFGSSAPTNSKLHAKPMLKDWERQLELFPQNKTYHMEVINMFLSQPSSSITLMEERLMAYLQCQNLHYGDLHLVTEAIANSCHPQLWTFWIDEAFELAHRINPSPLILWKVWRKRCPLRFRDRLANVMSKLLREQPNYQLEEWFLQRFKPTKA